MNKQAAQNYAHSAVDKFLEHQVVSDGGGQPDERGEKVAAFIIAMHKKLMAYFETLD